jgi:hypothetical protein
MARSIDLFCCLVIYQHFINLSLQFISVTLLFWRFLCKKKREIQRNVTGLDVKLKRNKMSK